jgi:hypothetical protein
LGLNAAARTQPPWVSVTRARWCHLPTSQTRAVWSEPVVASRCPLGLNATASTPPLWVTQPSSYELSGFQTRAL